MPLVILFNKRRLEYKMTHNKKIVLTKEKSNKYSIDAENIIFVNTNKQESITKQNAFNATNTTSGIKIDNLKLVLISK